MLRWVHSWRGAACQRGWLYLNLLNIFLFNRKHLGLLSESSLMRVRRGMVREKLIYLWPYPFSNWVEKTLIHYDSTTKQINLGILGPYWPSIICVDLLKPRKCHFGLIELFKLVEEFIDRVVISFASGHCDHLCLRVSVLERFEMILRVLGRSFPKRAHQWYLREHSDELLAFILLVWLDERPH